MKSNVFPVLKKCMLILTYIIYNYISILFIAEILFIVKIKINFFCFASFEYSFHTNEKWNIRHNNVSLYSYLTLYADIITFYEIFLL